MSIKKTLIVLTIFVSAGTLWAGTSPETLRSLYDVVAPVLTGNPATPDRQVGQIFYDVAAGAFKGVNHNGGIDRLSNASSGGGTGSLPRVALRGVSQNLVVDSENNNATLVFQQELYDTANAYDTTTGLFTVPATGAYTISAIVTLGGNFADEEIFYISVIVDGDQVESFPYVAQSATETITGTFQMDYPLTQGQTVAIGIEINSVTQPFAEVGAIATIKQIP